MTSPYKSYYPAVLILIGALCVMAMYAPAFNAPFQFDDYSVIVGNSTIKDLRNLYWIWSSDPSRFLTHLSFAMNYYLGGLDTLGYHIVNGLIHLGVGGILFLILNNILKEQFQKHFGRFGASFAVSFAVLIYLCHPLQTAAVTYTSQRSTLLAALFYLATIYFYARY